MRRTNGSNDQFVGTGRGLRFNRSVHKVKGNSSQPLDGGETNKVRGRARTCTGVVLCSWWMQLYAAVVCDGFSPASAFIEAVWKEEKIKLSFPSNREAERRNKGEETGSLQGSRARGRRLHPNRKIVSHTSSSFSFFLSATLHLFCYYSRVLWPPLLSVRLTTESQTTS